MIVNDGIVRDETQRDRLIKLKELINILDNCDNDFERAVKLRRVYSSYKLFMQSYYVRRKLNKDKTGRVVELIDDYANYREKLATLSDLYKNYEENGFFELAKEEEKYLIRTCGDLDSRYIIKAFIYDSCSYDSDAFFSRYCINRTIFEACLSRIKNHDKELYKQYLETYNNNKTKRLVMPIYNINQIIEGITTGKTIEGKKFDKLEFYRLAPFKDKDIDKEVRFISEDFPKLLIFKNLKQKYVNNNGTKINCTYADNLYLFTRCFSESQAEILKNWMDNNNIKNLTPIFRASTVNCYINESYEEFFDKDDANDIFDIIEENGYPKIYEVYNVLKEEKINKNKSLLLKENK